MINNTIAKIVQQIWDSLPSRFPDVVVDGFVIMPNHVHGIIFVGAQFIAPLELSVSDSEKRGVINHAPTLGSIVRGFKAISTHRIRLRHHKNFGWQRNYYEHIIRNDESLNRIRHYIDTNPLRWEMDRENSFAQGKDEFDIWLKSHSRASLKSKIDSTEAHRLEKIR